MDKFIQSLPKPVLAILIIFVGIIVIIMLNPPHTVCDTQGDSLRESLKGQLFASTIKKSRIPPTISRAKEACQLGNSSGSCYEYFSILRKVATDLNSASPACMPEIYEIAEVKTAISDGLELMARLAWGSMPPENTLERFGWMQESETAVYCRLRNVYLRVHGEEAWKQLRTNVYKKFPGELAVELSDPTMTPIPTKKATEVMSETEIWERSLFSARCENY